MEGTGGASGVRKQPLRGQNRHEPEAEAMGESMPAEPAEGSRHGD